jgi:hypothetical protein
MEVRSVEAIVRALNDAKVQYLIVDGLAVNAHGYERLTVDLDLVIGLSRDNIIGRQSTFSFMNHSTFRKNSSLRSGRPCGVKARPR